MLFIFMPAALDSFLLHLLISSLLTFRYSQKLRYIPGLITYLILLGRYFLFEEVESSAIYTMSKIVATLLIFVVVLSFYKDSFKKKAMIFLMFYLMLMITEGFVVCLLLAVSKDITFIELMQLEFVAKLSTYFAKLLGFFVVEYICLRSKKTETFALFYTKELSLILIYNIVLFVIVIHILASNQITTKLGNKAMLFISINVFFISMMSSLLMIKVSRRSKQEMQYRLALQQIELENKSNQEMGVMIQNVRSFRHDINNHLSVMSGLAKQKQFGDLEQYLDSITTDFSYLNNYILLDNKALTVLINNKLAKACMNHIEFTTDITVQSLPISDLDISTLLGNILDNAIDACLLVEDHPYIHLSIQKKGSQYRITCVNPYRVKPIQKGRKFLTTKSNNQIHGIGLENIRHIINKYNGELEICYKNQVFTLDAMIQEQEEAQDAN